MQTHNKSCGAAIAVLGALLLPSLSSADILACRGPGGTVTYTNGECAENTHIRTVLYGPRPTSMEDEQSYRAMRETSWTRPLKVRNRRPDVTSIHEAKLALQRMDNERRHRHTAGATQLAAYRE
jgi:hypothetical protein